MCDLFANTHTYQRTHISFAKQERSITFLIVSRTHYRYTNPSFRYSDSFQLSRGNRQVTQFRGLSCVLNTAGRGLPKQAPVWCCLSDNNADNHPNMVNTLSLCLYKIFAQFIRVPTFIADNEKWIISASVRWKVKNYMTVVLFHNIHFHDPRWQLDKFFVLLV